MKLRSLLLAATAAASPILAEEKPLTELDRELLVEKLQEIQNNSNATVKGRLATAIAAFKGAVGSDAAAHELYLKCIEKVRFQDEARKTREFREWKKRHKDRTDSPGFRRALRHQLNWLILGLEAANNKTAQDKMGSKVIAVLEAILGQAAVLKDQQRRLQLPVFDSVFAIASNVNGEAAEGWPEAPLKVTEIYENIVLPPLRTSETLPQLKKGWMKRIEQEGLLLEAWTDEGSAGKDRKPAFEKWLLQGRYDLMWQMEVDLFNAGDQRGAALRMLEILKEHLNHKNAPKWIEQFKRLVKGEGEKPATEDPEKPE